METVEKNATNAQSRSSANAGARASAGGATGAKGTGAKGTATSASATARAATGGASGGATATNTANAPRRGSTNTPRPRHVRQKGEVRTIVLKIIAVMAMVALCALGAFMIGDSNYQATMVGWVPLVSVVCVILLAFIYLCIIRGGLEISESTALGTCKKGDNVTVATTFKNKRPLFYFCIKVLIYITDSVGKPLTSINTTLALSPRDTYSMEFKVRFDHVGTYRAGVHEVVICDFLRLFTHRIFVGNQREVFVTPRVIPVNRITFSNDAELETQKAQRSAIADSLDYAAVREYVPGDPLKTIHWKISARAENYMTRLFEVYNNPGVAVVMDFYSDNTNNEALMGMFDAVVESAFSLANYSKEQGMDTEIHYVNKYGERCRRVSWSDADAQGIVKELPQMRKDAVHANETLELLHALAISQNGQNNLVVCTANLSAEMISLLIEAKGRKRNPILIAVVTAGLIGRERDAYCAHLGRLSTANIGYVVLNRADELGEANA